MWEVVWEFPFAAVRDTSCTIRLLAKFEHPDQASDKNRPDSYSTYTERRSASENCIIDNTHCIAFSF